MGLYIRSQLELVALPTCASGSIYNTGMQYRTPYPLLSYWFIWHHGRVFGDVGYFARRVEYSLTQQLERAALALAMLETVEQLFHIL
jgi:hypothetical protein